jgi:hypothetical protein
LFLQIVTIFYQHKKKFVPGLTLFAHNKTLNGMRQQRPFYIIGHNPNTIDEAEEFLENGANALEPDIVYAENQYYVSHNQLPSYGDCPTVEVYLQQLKALLLEKKYDLALIIWDIKTTNFDPNHFISIVKENFQGVPFDDVAMLMTNSDDHDFINQFKGGYDNVGVGVDESNLDPAALEQIFLQADQRNFSYADGITTFLTKPGVYKNIIAAQQRRTLHAPGSFSLIYTWVLSREAALRKYLDACIDGIMVEAKSAKKLKKLLAAPPYSEVYTLAKNGYNPFAASPIPAYLLTVETAGQLLAGTDAKLLFKLTGTEGSLSSLPFDGGNGALERNTTTLISLEGANLGDITMLDITLLTGGIGSGWLPKKITVEGKWINKPTNFIFNEEEWITKDSGTVVKFPS